MTTKRKSKAVDPWDKVESELIVFATSFSPLWQPIERRICFEAIEIVRRHRPKKGKK